MPLTLPSVKHGLGFRIQGLGLKVSSLGCRVTLVWFGRQRQSTGQETGSVA